ncbi:MAG: extracellular solute-binding protein [Actinobacteria bacterium]|nr:MAG: extracellular solute-binding protein [Actinomycetota bacterium]
MRKRLTLAALLAVAAIVAAVLTGASQAKVFIAGAAPAKVSAAPSGTVTLNGWQTSPAEETKLAKVVKDFEASHPRIHVNYTSITGNYQATMLAKFAARKPADVFYVDAADFADWVRQGVLQNLDSYVKASKFKTKPFYKNLLNTFRYKGHYYGFPKDWSSLGMEVNTDLLGNNPIPKTWAQLKSVASKITVPGGKPICLSADWARLMAFVYQAGGNGQFASATKAPFRTAVNYYVGLIKSGLAAQPSQTGSSWCGEAFGKARAAFAFEGNWMFPTMATFPNVKFTTAPLPKDKTRGNLAFTVSYSMAKDSKNKPAAWELLKYLVGRQGMQQWVSLGLALPTRTDVHAVAGRGAFTKYPAFVHGWGNQVGFRHVWNDVANNELTAVIDGKESVDSMLSKIAAAAG